MLIALAFQEKHTNIRSVDSLLWCLEAQANIFVPSSATLSDLFAFCGLHLLIEEDVGLFLEGALRLDCQFGRHDRDGLDRLLTWVQLSRWASEESKVDIARVSAVG